MSFKHTREEIAKQFDLPERQSKIESLLRQPEIYCICRSSDSTRFMIACDGCEEWYHGDCVNITQSEANNIHHYYCQWCIEKDPSLEIEYKKKSSSGHGKKDKAQKLEGKSGAGRPKKSSEKSSFEEKSQKSLSGKTPKGCGSCSGCLNRRDCGKCENCKKSKNKDKDKYKKKTCLKRMCVEGKKKLQVDKDSIQKSLHKSMKEEASSVLTSKQLNIADDEEDDWVPPVPTSAVQSSSKKQKAGRRPKKKPESKGRRKQYIATRESDISYSSDDDCVNEQPRECYWYQCVNFARPGSKYCSDECGVQLATERIIRLLPSRIQEWNLTPSVAEEKNKKELDGIRRKQDECKKAIAELEWKRNALDAHIEHCEQKEINPNEDSEDIEEEEGSVYCVTCGHEVSVKTCIKHMEKCYNKYESQTSFGSAFKTELEGTPIFCDFFHPVNRTYCKRLRVLCPEHSKEPKIRETAICGYPVNQTVHGPTDNICKLPKKKCNRHFSWEKLRRAEVDLEKVRYWLKLDELLTQERQVKQALTDRAGVLGLLLHSTFDHEIREKIQREQQEDEKRENGKGEEKVGSGSDPEEIEAGASKTIKQETEEINNDDEHERESDAPIKKFKQELRDDEEMHMDFGREYESTYVPAKSRGHAKRSKDTKTDKEEMTASKLFKMGLK